MCLTTTLCPHVCQGPAVSPCTSPPCVPMFVKVPPCPQVPHHHPVSPRLSGPCCVPGASGLNCSPFVPPSSQVTPLPQGCAVSPVPLHGPATFPGYLLYFTALPCLPIPPYTPGHYQAPESPLLPSACHPTQVTTTSTRVPSPRDPPHPPTTPSTLPNPWWHLVLLATTGLC